MNSPMRVLAMVACLAGPAVAQAVPVIYDFAGTGSVCTAAGTGSCQRTYEGVFTGTVSIDVLANGPSGADSFTDGSTIAYDYNGWVQSDFLIQWGDNSFNPGPVASQTSSDQYVQLLNNYGLFDQIANRESYVGSDGTLDYSSFAELNRASNPSWLSDLSFSVTGLSPGSNTITFGDQQCSLIACSGFSGMISLSSLSARTTSVPEPGTLALFGLGLAGLGLMRRRPMQREST